MHTSAIWTYQYLGIVFAEYQNDKCLLVGELRVGKIRLSLGTLGLRILGRQGRVSGGKACKNDKVKIAGEKYIHGCMKNKR